MLQDRLFTVMYVTNVQLGILEKEAVVKVTVPSHLNGSKELKGFCVHLVAQFIMTTTGQNPF